MNVEQVPITDIRPSKSNPRRNDSAVDAVARSIQAYGFNNPIITDANLNVAAGHTRLKAAILLGLEIVPVIRVPGLTGTKLTGFAIADNKTAELAEWDDEMLFRLVDDLNRDEEFDLSSIGFSDKELTEMLDKSVEDDEDQTPIAPDVPTTQPGDLYLLGNHRLLCGDASKPKSVELLMSGAIADCLITDPPYGVDYSSRGKHKDEWGKIENDGKELDALEDMIGRSLKNGGQACRSGAAAYVFHGISSIGIRPVFERSFVGAGFRFSATIIWVKQSAAMGWGDYREQYEAILYGWIGDGHRKITDRTQTTVWSVDRESNYRHPTQKPVSLISRAIRNSTVRGEVILDLFGGSGTTLIASEMLGRICCMMEMDPKYCDVIVERWERQTHQKAIIRRAPK